ncbi:transient receptor potential cation channel subfamily M member 8-like [Mya arenaria]|nr:transient receptor potential cation channel subfamily M member 8-like [Mya arenaria]
MIDFVPNVSIETFLKLAVDLDLNCKDIAKRWPDIEDKVEFIKYAFENDNWLQAMTLFTKESQKFYQDLLYSLKNPPNNSKITDTILKDTNTTGSNEMKTELLIFLWAIENEKFTVAKGLWMETGNMMTAALLAYTCLKKMKNDRTEAVDDLKRLQEMSQYYNDKAKDILTKCSRDEKEKTKKILVRDRDELDGKSLLQIAQNNKQFIAHDACHSIMNEIFYAPLEIKQKSYRTMRILVCVLLPFLAPLLLRFRKSANEDDSKNQRSKAIKFRNQVLDFWHAPVVKFAYDVLTFVIFLTLFALDLMFDTSKLTWNDGIIIAYVVSIAIEECRQMGRRGVQYIHDLWNEMDRISLQLFVFGKFFTHTNYAPEYGRVLLAFSFIVFSIRLLRVVESVPKIGPLLIMIKKMLADTFSIFGIIMVVMVCYAVSLRAILYPNSACTWLSFITAFKEPSWQIFGELVEVELEGDAECEANGTVTNSTTFCPSTVARFWTRLLLWFYMLTVQVLLINLLIAKFTHAVDKVQRKIEMHWRFLRCGLIRDYVDRPMIFHPFHFFYHVYTFIRLRASTNDHIKSQSGHSDPYCVTLRPGENISLRAWEKRREQVVLIEKRRNPCPTCAC